MRFYDIIEKKKRGLALSAGEIDFFVRSVTSGEVPDYQVAALLMAVYFRGMDGEETYELTRAMTESGASVGRGGIRGVVCDKHSTGGVSDSTTLVLIPVLAALGLKCAKLSGRGLGHTGGTLDKLESFPGLTTALSPERFRRQVEELGCAVAGQTEETVPADKKLYALRDVTATVDSLPLIASSVMSKKLASFADVILLDVKFGSGAFMREKGAALELAARMVEIGRRAGRKVAAALTDMNQPLSPAIGCNLEVKAALAALRGERSDLGRLSGFLARELLVLAGREREEAGREVENCIADGRAFSVFRRMIAAQGGDCAYADDPEKFAAAPFRAEVRAARDGRIGMNAETLGLASVDLGGGRAKKDDAIDHAAGLIVRARLGDEVRKGDLLAEVFAGSEERLRAGAARAESAFTYDFAGDPPPLVAAFVDPEGRVREDIHVF